VIARVSLDFAVGKEFDYLIPAELVSRIQVGARVKVPFGPREVLGAVTAIVDQSPHTNLRPITKVLAGQPPLTITVLKLARWISDYYCCPLETVLKTVLPEAVRHEEEGWKERLVVQAIPRAGNAAKLTTRQESILTAMEGQTEVPLQQLLQRARTTPATLRRMEELHLITITAGVVERDPYAHETIVPSQSLALNPEQASAFARICQAVDAAKSQTFLLHGVTGSGKTEVYLQAIAHALQQGKGAIVLVPEISLTPQTVERFKARFSSGPLQTMVAVLHSHLSAGERHDEWKKIRQGRARIVIGARSAIFAPVDSLGLVVVDEEHEYSYKQEEAPRYNARDVAVYRAQLENAVTVLGSATPSLESYYNAQQKKYSLLEMRLRADHAKMPIIRVVDMRAEARKEKGPPIFSLKLKEGITSRLEKGEQTMLFLNRRGYASSMQCPKCGYVAGCPNCSISLTYHRREQRLRCHICGHAQKAPTECPDTACKNPAIRFAGLGTEKIEETLHKLFPKARVARMDSDTLKRKEDYRRVLGDFKTGKTDILVGTQMIAKGLHFPNVTLVGIIHADLSLHMPDFRAGERTFQLLTQVAGRAGRGDVEGEVVVQAFTPFAPAIQYARRNDYTGFYDAEIEFRQQLMYPPLARAAIITLKSCHEDKVRFTADYVKVELQNGLKSIADLVVAGASPAPLLKAETFFRYQIMLRTRNMSALSKRMHPLLTAIKLPDDVSMVIDIDPVNLH